HRNRSSEGRCSELARASPGFACAPWLAGHGLYGHIHADRSDLWLDGGAGLALVAGRHWRGGVEPGQRRQRVGNHLRNPISHVLVTLGMTAMTFAMGGIAFWMPYYIHVFRGYGESQTFVTTTFGAIVVVAGLGATLLGGYVGDKLRPRFPGSYFLVSGLAMLIGFPLSVAMLYVPFPWAWIFIFLACFCLFFNTGPTNTILANVTHPSIRASPFAWNILV